MQSVLRSRGAEQAAAARSLSQPAITRPCCVTAYTHTSTFIAGLAFVSGAGAGGRRTGAGHPPARPATASES